MSSPSSKLQAPSSRSLIVFGLVGALAAPVVAQRQIFSTHDWTLSPSQDLQFKDAWADAKMPGGFPEFGTVGDSRRTYAVGQTEVHTSQNALFSGASASDAGLQGFTLTGATAKRQVVILQATNCGNNSIAWQSYFFGETGSNPAANLRATNARAVSVWEADAAEDARIAICGETYDEKIPLSQDSTGWAAANANHPSGYVAVFDGTGTLRWTYHFFAGTNANVDCAVTDISIRVDGEGNDVVTYCGISSHGLATSGTTYLDPILPFASPGTGLTSGSTNQGTGQWDGFVGRLIRTGSSAATRQFHSIVGGAGTDGLFGIAEFNPDFFAVVGFTETTQTSGTNFFPFPSLAGAAGPYRFGVLLVFDASQVPSNNLAIQSGAPIGTGDPELTTFARDVCVGFDALSTADFHKVYVVGSTNDPNFASTTFNIAPPVVGATMSGPSDGFLCMAHVLAVPSGVTIPRSYAYWGGEGDDGLTGVNNWNEFSEHIATVGFTDRLSTTDIGVSTWFCNESFGGSVPSGSVAAANNGLELILLRDTTIGATNGADRPAVMGPTCATSVGLAFDTGGLGQESGGGVAVGNDGRTNAVGYTDGTNYPVLGTGARAKDLNWDAVRTEIDMLPPAVSPATLGIGRTDGTGFQPSSPSYPPRNGSGQVIYSGGTTPTCGLRPFGRRIGETVPILQRMLIDYEGTPPANSVNDLAIIVSRPTVFSSAVAAGVLQLGLPPATPWLTLGADFWLGAPGTTNIAIPSIGTTSFRLPLNPLPSSGTGQLSAQLICLLDTNPVTLATGCSSSWTASPALWFEF